jgi:nitrate/nitrite-specific signal transduction histidine kinase
MNIIVEDNGIGFDPLQHKEGLVWLEWMTELDL